MSTSYELHIIFAGGGTGCHLEAGLNVASHVARQLPDAAITFVGTGRPMERKAAREAGYQYVAVSAQPAPRGPMEAFRFLTENVAGYWSARWLLRDQKATLVVGLGGLASGAVVRAGVARGIPTVLLEQNVVPSRVTRWIARDTSAVCAGFEQARDHFPAGANVQVVGNPVRAGLETKKGSPPKKGSGAFSRNGPEGASQKRLLTPFSATPLSSTKRLVVLGGNLGANRLNQAVPGALARLRDQLHRWCIVHQTGAGRIEETDQRYVEAGVDALTVGVLGDFAEVLAESDLVVSRGSGMTLAELALVAAPAVIVPFPDAADDHQMANARLFSEAGACSIVDEGAAGERLEVELAAQLGPLLCDDATRSRMSTAMLQLARPSAAKEISQIVADLALGRTAAAA